jgi:hypothetical protein
MKGAKAIMIGCVLSLILISTSAQAGDMYGRFQEQQQGAAVSVVNACLFQSDAQNCVDAMRDLNRAEMGLISYGKSYMDEDLYSRLADGLLPHQHRMFAWRVLKKRLADKGCTIESAGSVFP